MSAKRRPLSAEGRSPTAGGDRQCTPRGPGADGLQRERVTEVQRARILSATTHVAAERGAGHVTVAHVVERAGVSRRTFYELFSDSEQCLLEAIDQALDRARSRLLAVHDPHASWRDRVRGGLVALLELFDEEPDTARLLIVEALGAGPKALSRRQQALEPLIVAVDEGRREKPGLDMASPLTAEGVLGGVLSLIHTRIGTSPPRPLIGLVNELMSMIVLPYLGPLAARRERERPQPVANALPRQGAQAHTDPFKDTGMRLTYRTMRVLGAIAERPGCSNRQIGQLAGAEDQGQVSKLLARIARLGLIANLAHGSSKGQPNAWTLTPAGQQIVDSLEQAPAQTARARTFAEKPVSGKPPTVAAHAKSSSRKEKDV